MEHDRSLGRRQRPWKIQWEIPGLDKLVGQRFMQRGPFRAYVGGRRIVQEIFQLQWIGHQIVEFILDAAAIAPKIDCICPVVLPQRPKICAGAPAGKPNTSS